MLNTIFQHIKEGNFADLSGCELEFKMPLTVSKLNVFLEDIIKYKSGIEKLEVLNIVQGKINLQVTLGQVSIVGTSFELIDRELILQIDPNLHPPDFLLKMKVLDGIGRWENELLELLFDTLFRDSSIDFESRTILVNHSEFTNHNIYQGLLKNLHSARIQTSENLIEYDLQFTF